MVYADYTFYTDTYGGTAITAKEWPALALRASAYLDRLTFGRLAAGNVTDAVRLAVCAVAEAEQQTATPAGVKSENVDGYDVTYEDGAARLQNLNAARLAAADLYLSRGDPLRYAGVM